MEYLITQLLPEACGTCLSQHGCREDKGCHLGTAGLVRQWAVHVPEGLRWVSVGNQGRHTPHLNTQLLLSDRPVHPRLPEAPHAWNLEALVSAGLPMGSAVC